MRTLWGVLVVTLGIVLASILVGLAVLFVAS
jgi:hypothetical protein